MRQQHRQGPEATTVAPDGRDATSPRRRGGALIAAAVLAMAVAAPARAQSGEGYLFGQPKGSVTLRGGFSQARAGSDIFQESEQEFTLKKGDFAGLSGGIEASVRVAPQLDLSLDLGYMRTSAPSHYRDFVETSTNEELSQSTTLRRVPITIDAKLYLTPPGRSVGRFAWIPSTIAPWVAAGVGVMNYDFRQEGDFIDFSTLNVHSDYFDASGTTTMAQGIVGADVNLSPRLALTGDARYLLVRAPKLGSDFEGYQPIDLSGATVSLGLTVRL